MLIKERIYELFIDLENATLCFWINKIKIIMIITVAPKEGAKTEVKVYIYIHIYIYTHTHTYIYIYMLRTARRSNQSIQKEISPEYSLEGLMLKLKL